MARGSAFFFGLNHQPRKKTIMKIADKIKELIGQARAIVAVADEKTEGVLTEEQQTEYDGIMTKIETLKVTLERQNALDAVEAGLRAPQPRVTDSDSPPAPTPGLQTAPGAADPSVSCMLHDQFQNLPIGLAHSASLTCVREATYAPSRLLAMGRSNCR